MIIRFYYMLKEGVARGPEFDAVQTKEIKGIREDDLRVVIPEPDETVMVLQRNAKDDREIGSESYGALTPAEAEKTRKNAQAYFAKVFEGLSPEDRKTVEVLIVASDASLVVPGSPELNSAHKRGSETAEEVMKGVLAAMQEYQVPENQLLNVGEFAEHAEAGGPIEFNELEAAKILSQSPEYVHFLQEQYGPGSGKKFWVGFEQDTDSEKRKALGAEGVGEIADRVRSFIELLAKAGRERHKELPNKRLYVWAVSHYDALSPFIKVNVLKRPATDFLPMNAGSGITLKVDKDLHATTEINHQAFDVRL